MSDNLVKESVYVVIPVYNRKEMTLACLENLEQCGTLQRYHIVIVDDASTDGTKEAINHLYPDVMVVQGDGDLWWTGAMALGMQYAYEQGAEYFFWLNDDCVPQPKTLPLMTDFMQQHPDTIVSASFYTSGATAPVRVSGFRGRQGVMANAGEVVEVDGVSGWCVGIPASVFRQIGPPDAGKFPHYGGDSMYTYVATRAGFKVCILGDAIATLIEAGTSRGHLPSFFKPDLTLLQSLQSLFWHKKSPFRLPTQFFYHTTRYGIFLGTLLFLGKTLVWLGQWIQLQLTARFKLESLESP